MTDSRKHIVGPISEEVAETLRAFTRLRDASKVSTKNPNVTFVDTRDLEAFCAEARTKADAILASDGGREMVRELVEALEPFHVESLHFGSGRDDFNYDAPIINRRITYNALRRASAIHAKAKEWLEGNKS